MASSDFAIVESRLTEKRDGEHCARSSFLGCAQIFCSTLSGVEILQSVSKREYDDNVAFCGGIVVQPIDRWSSIAGYQSVSK